MKEKMDMSNIEKINGSGLFFWKSNIKDEKKIEIIKWYDNLSDVEKKYIDILMNESYEDAIYDCNENEDY